MPTWPNPLRVSRPPAPPADQPVDPLTLRRLQWQVLRPLARHLNGQERSAQRGPGLEIHEIRQYHPGDDVRRIDWNVTARVGSPHVREAEVERALDVWLLVDVSPAMHWGTALTLKRSRALEVCAVVGQLLTSRGNRIGAMLLGDDVLGIVPARSGRSNLETLLSTLRRHEGEKAGNLAAALTRAAPRIKHRSLVIVISDFLDSNDWGTQLKQLAARHEMVAVRVEDPREAELPNAGLLTLEDPETGRQVTVDTGSRRLRQRFAAARADQLGRIRGAFARAAVDELVVSTGADVLPPMVAFLQARRTRGDLRLPAASRAHVTPGGVR